MIELWNKLNIFCQTQCLNSVRKLISDNLKREKNIHVFWNSSQFFFLNLFVTENQESQNFWRSRKHCSKVIEKRSNRSLNLWTHEIKEELMNQEYFDKMSTFFHNVMKKWFISLKHWSLKSQWEIRWSRHSIALCWQRS